MPRFNPWLSLPRPTTTYHTSAYPAISPSRPELSMKGKTVIITGGATGFGLATVKAFAAAGADVVGIISRRESVLQQAKQTIEAEYPQTTIKTCAASVTDTAKISQFFKELKHVDVLHLNAAYLPKSSPLLESDDDEVHEAFSTNVLATLSLAKAFVALPPRTPDAPRTLLQTSTSGVHTSTMPGVAGYCSSKMAVTFLIRALHDEYADKNIRVFAFHPGVALNEMATVQLGITDDGSFQFDDVDLPGQYAVWLASPEADFLRGRFTWAQWDVDELKAKKDIILADPSQLNFGLVQDKIAA